MAGPIAIDTPDYQRGLVSAQKLLASMAAGTTEVAVGLPPNTETLVVVTSEPATSTVISCLGLTTGTFYPGGTPAFSSYLTTTRVWFFDVSAAADAQVEVSFSTATTSKWYVYADSGPHISMDVSKLVNAQGMQSVIPCAPNTAANDHPFNELNVGGGLIMTSGIVVVAPGAGKRLRLFALNLDDNGSSSDTVIAAASGNPVYFAIAAPGSGALALPLTGMPMPANTALAVSSTSSTRAVYAIAYYTVESV